MQSNGPRGSSRRCVVGTARTNPPLAIFLTFLFRFSPTRGIGLMDRSFATRQRRRLLRMPFVRCASRPLDRGVGESPQCVSLTLPYERETVPSRVRIGGIKGVFFQGVNHESVSFSPGVR